MVVLYALQFSISRVFTCAEMDRERDKKRGALAAGKKRSNKHKKKPGPGEDNGTSASTNHELNVQLHVRRSLCRGIARVRSTPIVRCCGFTVGMCCCAQLLAGVSASYLLKNHEREAAFEYTSWKCRFEHRFTAFANLSQPPVLRFEEFEHTLSGEPDILLGSAAECFKQCKTLIDRMIRAMPDPDEAALIELRNLTKVAVANGVAIAQVQAAGVAAPGPRVELNYDLHPLFPRVLIRR